MKIPTVLLYCPVVFAFSTLPAQNAGNRSMTAADIDAP